MDLEACNGAAVAAAFEGVRALLRDAGAVADLVALVAEGMAGTALLVLEAGLPVDRAFAPFVAGFSAGTVVALPVVAGTTLCVGAGFFTDVTFFTAMFGPFTVALCVFPGKCGQVA
ncbi:MAG: hypothetical protein ABIP19_09370 [Dermatophilaceae bacterium]